MSDLPGYFLCCNSLIFLQLYTLINASFMKWMNVVVGDTRHTVDH